MENLKKLDEFKSEMEIMSLQIEGLSDLDKVQAIKHLEETISILKLGNHLNTKEPSPKKIKTETPTGEYHEEEKLTSKVEVKEEAFVLDDDSIKSLYNGMMPSCKSCGKQFPSLGALDDHMRYVHGEYTVKQDTNAEPATEPDLKEETKPSISIVNCNLCDKTFSKRRNLLRHKVSHSKQFQCQTCEHGFNTQNLLNTHLRSPDNCKKFLNKMMTVKTENSKESLLNESLKIDKMEEDDIKYVPDPLLLDSSLNQSVSGTQESKPEISESKHETSTSKTRFCDTCNISTVASNFSRHVEGLVHKELKQQRELGLLLEGVTLFRCRTCQHESPNMKAFHSHISKHINNENKEKSALHPQQEKESELEASLPLTPSTEEKKEEEPEVVEEEEQVDEESGKKKFKCQECGNMFSWKQSLRTHMRIHTDCFKCPKCEKQFSTNHNFKYHKCVATSGSEKKQETEVLEEVTKESVEEDNDDVEMEEAAEATVVEEVQETSSDEEDEEPEDIEVVETVTPKDQEDISEDEYDDVEEIFATFNCNECDAVLTSNDEFAEHMSKHEEDDEDMLD